MADIDDYGMQMEEVVQTFHLQGKCVGCDYSQDSYCTKHKGWGYNVTNCTAEAKPPKKEVVKRLEEKTAHNAKQVRCSNGITYPSLLLAAKAFKISPGHLRRFIREKRDYATYTFEVVEADNAV